MRDEQAIKNLSEYVAEFNTQSDAAESLSISSSYLCDLLKGHRAIPDSLADRLASGKGYERVIKYIRKR